MGCGWLGFPLGQELVKTGYTVLGSTTTEAKLLQLKEAGIRPYLIAVDDELSGQIDDFFQTDVLVINIPPGRRRPDVLERYPEEIKLIISRALADGVKNIVFISSSGVYEDVNREVTEEEINLVTKGSGGALVICEDYLKSLPDMPLTILRLSGLVGGERKAGRFLAGKKNVANGNAPVNMVHQEDCIAVIKRIIEDHIWGETFNVCADEHPTRRDFYTQQARKDGFEPPTFADDADGDFKIVLNLKLKERLHYEFRFPDPLAF